MKHPAIDRIFTTDDFDEEFASLGQLFEEGQIDALFAALDTIRSAATKSDIVLECLALYGKKHFQREIDTVIKECLSSENNSVVFAAIACYFDMSPNARQECSHLLEDLDLSLDVNIRRAANVAIKTLWLG